MVPQARRPRHRPSPTPTSTSSQRKKALTLSPPDTGTFGEIDWQEFRNVLAGHGPCNRERLEERRKSHAEGGPGSAKPPLAYAAKQRPAQAGRLTTKTPDTPLWEVFIRSRNGLAHKHAGSVHAADAIHGHPGSPRRLHPPRRGPVPLGRPQRNAITASDPADKAMLFEPTASKIYRHPTFYEVPDEVGHM